MVAIFKPKSCISFEKEKKLHQDSPDDPLTLRSELSGMMSFRMENDIHTLIIR